MNCTTFCTLEKGIFLRKCWNEASDLKKDIGLLQQVILGLYDFRTYSFQIEEFWTISKYAWPLNCIFPKSFPGPEIQHCDSYYKVNPHLLVTYKILEVQVCLN